MSPIPFSLLITSALSTYKRFISDSHWLILRPPFFLLVALRKLCLYTYLWVQFFFNKVFNSWVFFFHFSAAYYLFPHNVSNIFFQFEFEEDNKNEHLKLFVEEKKTICITTIENNSQMKNTFHYMLLRKKNPPYWKCAYKKFLIHF